MAYRNRIITLRSVCSILLSWILASNFGLGEPTLFRLPSDRDTVFRSDSITSTEYFSFHKDGTYMEVSWTNLGKIPCDHGTWKQNDMREIELRSKERVKNLRCGSLTIEVWSTQRLKSLRNLRDDMAGFLVRSDRNSFTAEEIKRAWEYSYSPFDDVPGVVSKVPAVSVAAGVTSISRRNIEDCLRAWEEYLSSADKNLFHVSVVGYRGLIVLVPRDGAPAPYTSVAEAKEYIDRLMRDCRPIAFISVMIPYEQYLDEIKRNESIFGGKQSSRQGVKGE